MRIEEIRDREAFEALAPEWDAFVQAQGDASWFRTHAWLRSCLFGCPVDARPLVLVAREGDAIAGILPFFLRKSSWRVFPARVLYLMQSYDSPFADLVLPKVDAGRVLDAALRHLAGVSGWDMLALLKISPASRVHATLAHGLVGAPHLRLDGVQSPALELEGDWASYWQGTSQRFKKTVRNVENRLERLGAVTVEEIGSTADAATCLDLLRTVEGRSWKTSLSTSLARNAEIARFFDALTPSLQEAGRLLFWVVRLDGEPVATEYHLRDDDAVYALRGDFDDRYKAASPGAYLNYRVVRSYFEQGVRLYDMGPGESEYKQRWANRTVQLDNFWVFNRTPYATALYQLERRVVPSLRAARAALPSGLAGSERPTHAGKAHVVAFGGVKCVS